MSQAPAWPAHRFHPLGDLRHFQRRPLAFLLELARADSPVTRVRFGPWRQLVVSHPAGARHVLQSNSRHYRKDQDFLRVARGVLLSRTNLFTSDGQPWLQRRRLMQPAFHRQAVAGFAGLIVAETTRLAAGWPAGLPVDLEAAMMDLTIQIIGRAMLSRDILRDHPQLYRAFEVTSGMVIDRATTIAGRLTPAWWPSARHRAFRRALTTIRQSLAAAICERQAQPPAAWPADLLSTLLSARDEESGFVLSTENLMDELYGIVTAGHETSAVALAWLFYETARRPELQDALQAELDTVLAGAAPDQAQLQRLTRLGHTVEEALRRYPSAYVTTRQATAADEILGYTVPAGTTVLINIYGLHHHPLFWSEPMTFDPERWSHDPDHQGAFLPFGAGPRQCIGAPLAALEMRLIAATLLQRFRFDLAADRPAELIARFTLRARDGVWLRVRPR